MANDVEFEVTETAEIQKVTMKDEYVVGKIIINKTDSETKKPIAGVEFEIRDKDGNVIEKLVTDKNGHAESKELPICIYNEDGTYKEDIHYYVVETNKPSEPGLPQTGDNFNPMLFVGLGLASLLAGVAMFFWKKKEDDAEEA